MFKNIVKKIKDKFNKENIKLITIIVNSLLDISTSFLSIIMIIITYSIGVSLYLPLTMCLLFFSGSTLVQYFSAIKKVFFLKNQLQFKKIMNDLELPGLMGIGSVYLAVMIICVFPFSVNKFMNFWLGILGVLFLYGKFLFFEEKMKNKNSIQEVQNTQIQTNNLLIEKAVNEGSIVNIRNDFKNHER